MVRVDVPGLSLDEGQNLASLLIKAEHTRRLVKADGLQVTKQAVNRRGPWHGRPVHRVPDSLDPASILSCHGATVTETLP